MASWSERRPARVMPQSATRPRNTQGSAEASRSSSGSWSGRQPVSSRMRREICGIFSVAGVDARQRRIRCARSSHRSRCRTTAGNCLRHEWRAICNDCRMTNLANLDRVAHQNLRVQEERAFAACKDITMCAVVLNEIPRLVIEYPIGVHQARRNRANTYVSRCLAWIRSENLYWRDERWNSVTVPLNIGRQPFFVGIADNPAAGAGAKGLVTCIDLENPGVQIPPAKPLFDANGGETPYLRHKLALLAELIDGEQKSRAFADRLVALDLLRRFSSSSRRRTSRRARSAGCIRSTRRSCGRSTRRRSRSCTSRLPARDVRHVVVARAPADPRAPRRTRTGIASG